MISKSARVALHIVDATVTELPRTSRRTLPAIWKAWMNLAALALASTALAVIIVWILRRIL